MKYNIIYIDPPWGCYRDKASAGHRGAYYKYPVMSLDEIKNLPIEEIAAKDCVLFLWATWPLLQEALDVIKAWSFLYRTVGFVWCKMNKKNTSSLFWGMGNYSRSNSEICLIATRGKPKVKSHSIHSIVMTPIEKHSRKPGEIRNRITELFGELPRIELFARPPLVSGWHAIGNDIDDLDIRTSLRDIINQS